MLPDATPIGELNIQQTEIWQAEVEKFDPPEACTERCATCGVHFTANERQNIDGFLYMDKLSDQDAQEVITGLIKTVDDHRQQLQNKMDSHGDHLLKRWLETSDAQIRKIFDSLGIESMAYPQVYRYQQADLGWHEKRKYRHAFMTPQLNAADLCGSKARLLRILHYRIIHLTAYYFWDDLRSIIFPLQAGLFDLYFNAKCMVTEGPQRGQLVPWDAGEVHLESMCGFPVARVVLESQELLLRTLRAIVDKLVQDDKKASGCKNLLARAKTDFKDNSEHFHAKYDILEAPYGPPHTLDASEIQTQSRLRRTILIDHLKDLQTDPPYVQSIITTMKGAGPVIEDMRAPVQMPDGRTSKRILRKRLAGAVDDGAGEPSVIKSSANKTRKEPTEKDKFWIDAAKNIWLWDWMRAIDMHQVDLQLTNMTERLQELMSPTQDSAGRYALEYDIEDEWTEPLVYIIPECYADWICAAGAHCLENFDNVLEKGPSWGLHFELPIQDWARDKTTRRELYTQDRLLWCLLQLFDDLEPDPRDQVHTSILMSMLADEMCSAKSQERLDVKSLLFIDDLLWLFSTFRYLTGHDSPQKSTALMSRLTYSRAQASMIDSMQNGLLQSESPQTESPQTKPAQTESAENEPGTSRTTIRLRVALSRVTDVLNSKTGHALKEAFRSRWPKRPTTEYINQTRVARKKLATFWDLWRSLCKQGMGDMNARDDERAYLNLLKTDLEDEHKARVQEEELAITSLLEGRTRGRKRKSDPEEPEAVVTPAEPRRHTLHDSTPAPQETIKSLKKKKQKIKTTGTPAPPTPIEEPQQLELPESPVSPDLPKVQLSKSNYSVVERLFPLESGVFKESTIRFQDLVAALVEAGLEPVQGQGSAMTFKLPATKDRQAVRFAIHRPHRRGDNVDNDILRRIGWRLRDRFGWKFGHFAIRQRGG